MRHKIISFILALCISANMTGMTLAASVGTSTPVYITTPSTNKASSKSIRIFWGSAKDALVTSYYVMKREVKNNIGTGQWETIGEVQSDGVKGGPVNAFTDSLSSMEPQQYEYKVCTLSKDQTIDTRDAVYEEITDKYSTLGTNIKICIDPGHYGSLNNNYEFTDANGRFPYSEAEFTLKIGKALQTELKQSYGIDSYMTRTGSSISFVYNGRTYANENLDKKNISVRGAMAKVQDCDFFISLHTNSTSRQINPWNQSKKINKVFVFVNEVAHASDRSMEIANTIGERLTAYNQGAGIQTAGFVTRGKNRAANFSTSVNDSAKTDGTVIYRPKSTGGDYYGVLRGANAAGVPGILVEHAFHATQIMRKQANASSKLFENWAVYDAYGIACGFDFT